MVLKEVQIMAQRATNGGLFSKLSEAIEHLWSTQKPVINYSRHSLKHACNLRHENGWHGVFSFNISMLFSVAVFSAAHFLIRTMLCIPYSN